MAILRSLAYSRAVRAASRMVAGKTPIGRLLVAAAMVVRRPGAGLAGLRSDVQTLLRMMRSFASGRYRRVPRSTLIGVLAGLIYLVNPLDIVPDVIPALGLVDDAVVVGWVMSRIRKDLASFLAWEREWGGVIDVEAREELPPALRGSSG